MSIEQKIYIVKLHSTALIKIGESWCKDIGLEQSILGQVCFEMIRAVPENLFVKLY